MKPQGTSPGTTPGMVTMPTSKKTLYGWRENSTTLLSSRVKVILRFAIRAKTCHSPGDSAASHDVYLGENFDDVFDATHDSAFYQGNQTSTFYMAGFPGFAYPDGLVPGLTYYWRIDEVNDANPNSPWKGNVWSFSIPPKTAYSPDPADGAEVLDPDDVKLSWTDF